MVRRMLRRSVVSLKTVNYKKIKLLLVEKFIIVSKLTVRQVLRCEAKSSNKDATIVVGVMLQCSKLSQHFI